MDERRADGVWVAEGEPDVVTLLEPVPVKDELLDGAVIEVALPEDAPVNELTGELLAVPEAVRLAVLGLAEPEALPEPLAVDVCVAPTPALKVDEAVALDEAEKHTASTVELHAIAVPTAHTAHGTQKDAPGVADNVPAAHAVQALDVDAAMRPL